jgi:16S rRNA (adenine1518-N6/adenine1519-N6)-dimethyltransferase
MTTPSKILKSKGIRPDRRLGQTFLDDRNMIAKIIAVLDVQKDDAVIEIGAGTGIMTAEIAKKAGKVVALEIDPYLISILEERLSDFKNVDVVHADVLDFDFASIRGNLPSGKIKIIGNIPYHISSQILFRLIDYRDNIFLMVLMFQKELADRICAHPGSKNYGIPSVLVDMYTVCTRELNIPGQCFYPKPMVTSSVLKLVIREKPKIELNNHAFFTKIVRLAFSKRRKVLFNNLRCLSQQGYSEDEINKALQNSGVDGRCRGETLTSVQLGELSNALHDDKKS